MSLCLDSLMQGFFCADSVIVFTFLYLMHANVRRSSPKTSDFHVLLGP